MLPRIPDHKIQQRRKPAPVRWWQNTPAALILSVAISFIGGIFGASMYTVWGHPALPLFTLPLVVIGTFFLRSTILLRSKLAYLVIAFAVASGVALATLLRLAIPGLFSTLTGIGFIIFDSLVTLGGVFLTRKFLFWRDSSKHRAQHQEKQIKNTPSEGEALAIGTTMIKKIRLYRRINVCRRV